MTGTMSATARGAMSPTTALDDRHRACRLAHVASASPYLARMAESITMSVAAVLVMSGSLRLVLAAVVVLRALRTPTPRLTVRPLDGLARGIVDLTAAFGGAALVVGAAVVEQSAAWAIAGGAGLAAGVGVELGRWALRRWTTAGRLRVALLVGRGHRAGLARILRQQRRLGLDPVVVELPLDGALDGGGLEALGGDEQGGTDLVAVLDAVEADAVVAVEAGLSDDAVGAILRAVEVPLFLAPTHGGTVGVGGEVETLWANRVVPARVPVMQRPSWMARRAVERVVAGLALVALSPLLGLLALGVRLSSPGPVLFRQERVGLRGEAFTILKFRSMPVDHDPDAGWNAASRATPTRLGRVMRELSLDELPQLLNVVRGEMSLVGPRPEVPRYVRAFAQRVPGYGHRHRLPVGHTGWAQVHGLRGDTSIADRVRFDNNYIDDWSPGRDLAIVLRTVVQLLPERFRPQPPALAEVVPADEVSATEDATTVDEATIDLRDDQIDLSPSRPKVEAPTARAS